MSDAKVTTLGDEIIVSDEKVTIGDEVIMSDEKVIEKVVLRWGIVSASKISSDFVSAFNSYPEIQDQVIAAVAARDVARAQEFAAIHNIEHIFESYKEMAESSEIDVAYIGSLNTTHYELTMLFLQNKKHVLCEKPLCLNATQTERLINFANQENLFLLEGMWCRFCPAYLSLEKDLEDDEVGDVYFVEANFGIPQHDIDRICKKEMGGSTLMDIGTYCVQFAQFIFKDRPMKITATGELNEDGVDVLETIILEYSGEKRAVLNAHGKLKLWNKATIYGTKGRLTLEEPFNCPPKIRYDDGSVEKFSFHKSQLPFNYENRAGLVYEALETQRCIAQGLIESPRYTHAETLALAKLLDEIKEQLGVVFDVDDQEVCRCPI